MARAKLLPCTGSGTLLGRRLKVFAMAIAVFFDYKRLQRRSKWIKDSAKVDALYEAAHERNAARIFSTICALEGLWVKAGQYLSSRADVLPEAYISRLKLLQDALPPRPLEEIVETVEEELGGKVQDLFTSFDETPLATASIAQVHRAVTLEGQQVVVKVQHRGIKEVILQDLSNLRTIVEWIAWSDPQYNFGPMIDEWCAEVPKELNFEVEAANTDRVRTSLSADASAATRVEVLLPAVVRATQRVLLLEFFDGLRLNNRAALDAHGVDRQRLVEVICRAYARQIYVDGFFNADPHPGNFLVSKVPPHAPILLDFGLTKTLRPAMKVALAKQLLAAAEMDMSALLSSFEEMGLRLNRDMPEESLALTNFFFRRAAPAQEAKAEFEKWRQEREEEQKRAADEDKGLRRNPVDAFPADAVFFIRVLNLLRGLSSSLDTRIEYLEVMRPFAEATLSSELQSAAGPSAPSFVLATPVRSVVDERVRALLTQLAQGGNLQGIQVCVYHRGAVVVDCAGGRLGRYDPRPVQLDSLFPCFSVTKGVTAGLLHWLHDKGKLPFDALVGSVWPGFAKNGKETTTVAHLATHRAGLPHAGTKDVVANPTVVRDWQSMLRLMEEAWPETPPGTNQMYHYLSFGWLAGGLIEAAAGHSYGRLLQAVFATPLGLDGEFYVGIPPGVETRLASLSMDRPTPGTALATALATRQSVTPQPGAAASSSPAGDAPVPVVEPPGPTSEVGDAGPGSSADVAAGVGPGGSSSIGNVGNLAALPLVFNNLFVRRACIPSANGHFSARALARFYASMARAGAIPPAHPGWDRSTETPQKAAEKGGDKSRPGLFRRGVKKGSVAEETPAPIDVALSSDGRLFDRPAEQVFAGITGVGPYAPLVPPESHWGLAFGRFFLPGVSAADQSGGRVIAFGHSGMGGSTAFCDPEHDFAIAVTINKMTVAHNETKAVVRLVCEQLGVPVPASFLLQPPPEAQAT
ncbi:ABC1 family protein [Klebsormidium nitens]|uniref:ABC1 family protein n=1 Tax=Klebsormidium nitens TaxID=105231 RepID=A0A1Y1IGE8_KLENI|nr:ABC1 family protein [Klebsormidium nitens]|eukprot:GAQ87218.1 ABC1 family protein [Klebsormidium nitens]